MITDRPSALVALKEALQAAACKFDDPALERCLDTAFAALNRDWPRWRLHEFDVALGEVRYPAPAGALRASVLFWGTDERIPAWSPEYAGPKPTVRLVDSEAGKQIEISAAPTGRQLMRWGSRATVRLAWAHELTAEATTLEGLQPHALLLRAQAEAMRALANAGVVQPIQRHQGMGASLPSGSTPAALAQEYLREYRELVACIL